MNVSLSTDFERQDCISCGVTFFIPVVLGNNLRDSKNNFYCPNGHPQAYVKSRAEKLQEQLDQEKQSRQNVDQRLANLLEQQRKTAYELEQCQIKMDKKKVRVKK